MWEKRDFPGIIIFDESSGVLAEEAGTTPEGLTIQKRWQHQRTDESGDQKSEESCEGIYRKFGRGLERLCERSEERREVLYQ